MVSKINKQLYWLVELKNWAVYNGNSKYMKQSLVKLRLNNNDIKICSIGNYLSPRNFCQSVVSCSQAYL